MTRSNGLWRGLGKLHKSGAAGIAGVVLLFGPAWAGPPNPTPSDAAADTAGGTGAVANTLFGANTGFGFEALISNTTGQENAAFGAYALYSNGANDNTATGFIASSATLPAKIIPRAAPRRLPAIARPVTMPPSGTRRSSITTAKTIPVAAPPPSTATTRATPTPRAA